LIGHLERNALWIHPHDLLESLRDRLLDFLLFELNEGAAPMKTLSLNRRLLLR
jgi:hypothetical protein